MRRTRPEHRAAPSQLRRIATISTLTLGAVLSLGRFAAAQTTQSPSLHFADAKISVQLKTGSTATQNITIVNDGTQDVDVGFMVLLPEASDKSVGGTVDGDSTVPAGSAAIVAVKFTSPDQSADFTGKLLATAPGRAPAVADFELLAVRDLTTLPKAIVVVAFLVASAIVVQRGRSLKSGRTKIKLERKMGPVNWKFGDAWASNLTAVGAILGTVVGASLLPDRRMYVSKDWLTALNLFFGALVVISPFVYTATRTAKKPYPEGDKEPEYLGTVGTFLLAGGITLWAVLGELATTGLFLLEIQSKLESAAPAWIAGALLLGVSALAIRYSWTTLGATAEAQVESASKARRRTHPSAAALKALENLNTDDPEVARLLDRQLLPTWSVM